MPEGDTVFRTARRLDAALAGAEVTGFEIRVPRSATVDLRGRIVHEVVARGKHLLIRIGEDTLHSHLKMEGEWDLYRPGERWHAPAFRARAIMAVPGVQAVGFDLSQVEVRPRTEEDRWVGHLGPDPLGDDWDLEEAARRVQADGRAIHVALLDQRHVAGFGNEYANELLFVRGIDPTRPATEVDAVDLLRTGAQMIRQNRDRPRRTFTGDERPGRRTWVYGREGRPCRRCGTPIRRILLGASPTAERIVFFCPDCQR